MVLQNKSLDFYTSYSQFFILDPGFPSPGSDMWDMESHTAKLWIGPKFLSVGTGCYGPVKGELVVLDKRPISTDFTTYDHVVEGSIFCESGILEIVACTSNEAEFKVELGPGDYRVRIYSSGLDTVVGDEGDDFYRVEIWEEPFSERTVLKMYKSPS